MAMAAVTEQALYDELLGLISALYRAGEADEIIEAFQSSLEAHKSVDERMGILAHWVDFYRVRKYRRDRQRRRPTYRERITACAACGYPASHRHHIYDVATHGEHAQTVQLCANCHELQHLIYNALVNESDYSRKLVNHIMYADHLPPGALDKLLQLCRATIRYEAKQGWVSADKASDEWVELTLRWSEYQRHVSAKD
jgi:ribosomal protein L37E